MVELSSVMSRRVAALRKVGAVGIIDETTKHHMYQLNHEWLLEGRLGRDVQELAMRINLTSDPYFLDFATLHTGWTFPRLPKKHSRAGTLLGIEMDHYLLNVMLVPRDMKYARNKYPTIHKWIDNTIHMYDPQLKNKYSWNQHIRGFDKICNHIRTIAANRYNIRVDKKEVQWLVQTRFDETIVEYPHHRRENSPIITITYQEILKLRTSWKGNKK